MKDPVLPPPRWGSSLDFTVSQFIVSLAAFLAAAFVAIPLHREEAQALPCPP